MGGWVLREAMVCSVLWRAWLHHRGEIGNGAPLNDLRTLSGHAASSRPSQLAVARGELLAVCPLPIAN